jgi:hypothetical protein
VWAIFVVVPAAISVVSSLFSLSSGVSFAIAAAATSELQRRKGYKPGEGHFTERANNAYYGVKFDASAEYDLSRDLGRLGKAMPGLFQQFLNSSFDITRSEGEFLRTLMVPVLQILDELDIVQEMIQAQDEGATDLLNEVASRLAIVVIPVSRWLQQFPHSRKKSCSERS